ncbi:hypothetical protein HNP77_001917 [Treponema rectale]|uniref:Lipoprotein n=1 Tax=Treponema rectale TaxID=744512 RepID=A0A840SFN0_9SPIR|nr:hypothetical protein [Treponema rectale]MBB5219535.1 hypothetical protein [Treponema rectale]
MNKLRLLSAILLTAVSILSFSCNEEVTDDFDAYPSEIYKKTSALSENAASNVDLTHIKSIKLYNFCMESGWANVPVKLVLYTDYLTEYQLNDYASDGDILFNELPFADFEVDRWGYTIEWTAADTGVWSGSAKTIPLRKTLNLEKYSQLVTFYELYVDKTENNSSSRIGVAFVDSSGNETPYDNFSLTKTGILE